MPRQKKKLFASPKPAKAPRKLGRPSLKTPELIDEFCRRLATGRALINVCKDADMPEHTTIWRWERDDSDFRNKLARARANRSEGFANRLMELADKAMTDKKIDPARIRAASDAITRAAQLVQPKRLEVSGPNGAPVPVNVSHLTDEQLAAAEAALSKLVGSASADSGGVEDRAGEEGEGG